MMPETLKDIGEFGLIARIDDLLKREGVQSPGVSLGIGDDTASFKARPGYEVLVTCDCVVEGRHFLSRHISAMDLGRRSMMLNISDIGAMGGHPLYALISLGLKSETLVKDIENLYRGFLFELNPFGASIIGGNLTKSGDGIFIDITLIGELADHPALYPELALPQAVDLNKPDPGSIENCVPLLLHVSDKEVLEFGRHHRLVRLEARVVLRRKPYLVAVRNVYARGDADGLVSFDLAHKLLAQLYGLHA